MHIFVAGTFDRFHDGHEYLLRETFSRGNRVTIGITSDTFVKQYKQVAQIESFSVRKNRIAEWGKGKNISIVAIHDRYEPAVSGEFDALIVTQHNKETGVEINKKRKEKQLKELVVIEIPLLPAYDGSAISSTRIRSGEIDGSGNLYLPELLRNSLKQPLGTIISPEKLKKRYSGHVVTVGDVTTDVFLERGIIPDLAIIDLHARRRPYKSFSEFPFPEHIYICRVTSGPGYISEEAIHAIKTWEKTRKKTVILVKGEDDLLVLPAILCASTNTILYYGQPNLGIVEVVIDQDTKRKAEEFLTQFSVLPVES